MKTKLIILLFLFFLSSTALAQDVDFGTLLLKGTKSNYLGQYSETHKHRGGTGIYNFGGGSVYIGDFSRNKYNGRGMMIVGLKGKIDNAPGAMVYVGAWVQGKKEGKGICYAPNGDVIYSGTFKNDKPVDVFPQEETNVESYFSMMELEEGYYIGEIVSGNPNGFGLYLEPDASYWIGNTKDGNRTGIGIFIYGEDEWSVVNYKNGEAKEINSSEIYAARRQKYHEIQSRYNAQFWHDMADVFIGLSDVGVQYAEARSGGSTGNTASGNISENSTSGASGKNMTSSSSAKKSSDCGTSWMSDSRVYSNYESQIIKGGLSAGDLSSIRSKMRSIRTKWEKRGCPITKSSYE